MKSILDLIPKGWRFDSAHCSGGRIWVHLGRVAEDANKWQRLSPSLQQVTALSATGPGNTFEEALAMAVCSARSAGQMPGEAGPG